MLSTRRTFLLILAVLAIPFGLFLLWAQFELGPQLEERAVGQLSRTARLIGEDFRDRPFSDSLADRLGEITDLRVTLISRDGSVIGDSEIDPARLPLPRGFARACRELDLDPRRLALTGGEDYELLFSLRASTRRTLSPAALGARLALRVTEIGRVTRQGGLCGLPAGRGWRHF